MIKVNSNFFILTFFIFGDFEMVKAKENDGDNGSHTHHLKMSHEYLKKAGHHAKKAVHAARAKHAGKKK